MNIVCVTIDSRNPSALAEFWNTALDWDGVDVESDESRAVCRPAGDGMFLEFIHVPEPKTAKNRLHFGCSAGKLDGFDDEFARLQSLGAELAWREDFGAEINADYRNWVLRDPEGNEFCLGGGDWPDGVEVPGEVTISYP